MVRRSRVSTRRGIYSALDENWIESPATGAALRRAAMPSEDDVEKRADQLSEQGYPGRRRDHLARARAEFSRTLTVVRRFGERMGRFPAHVHLDFAERFEVIRGVAEAQIDGDTLRLTSEKGRRALYVPPGVPHINPYNDGRGELEIRQSFEPATEGARSYIETLAAVLADGRDHGGDLPWPLVAAVADVTGERSYLTPVLWRDPRGDSLWYSFQRRVLLPIGAAVAKRLDLHVHLESTDGPRPRRHE